MLCMFLFFFSSSRRHTRCALVTGVQTCALPICFSSASCTGSEGLGIAPDEPRTTTEPKRMILWPMVEAFAVVVRFGCDGAAIFCTFSIEIGRASCRERVCQYV